MRSAYRLMQPVWSTSLHGITGQAYEEGWLDAGALIRNVQHQPTPEGTLRTFEASTDGGHTWWRQETYQRLYYDTSLDERFDEEGRHA